MDPGSRRLQEPGPGVQEATIEPLSQTAHVIRPIFQDPGSKSSKGVVSGASSLTRSVFDEPHLLGLSRQQPSPSNQVFLRASSI